MKTTHRRVALALILSGLIQASASACDNGATSSPAIHLAAESPVLQRSGPQLGAGPHSYRFVVRDPLHTGRPYRNGRYQIELKGEATFPDGTHFYRGKTDGRGRTATFRFSQPVAIEDWFVQPLAGQGNFGETFHVSSEGECSQDVVNYSYMLNGDLGPIFCGNTLPGGITIRYMMPMVTGVQIYYSQMASECLALQRRINPVMARRAPAQQIAGLQQLLRDKRLSEHEEMLQGKIKALTIRYGSLAQVEAHLKRKLAGVDNTSKAQSEVYNEVAYDLISQAPPRFPAYANALLDKSVSLDENIFNMDSKAWALHLLGRDQEALGWLNRALPQYGTQCSAIENASYQETLAHRGMVLWALKQPTEALTDWSKANLLSRAGGWSNFIPDWKSIEPLIATRTADLQAEGFVNTVCSEATPEVAETAPEEAAKSAAND